MDEVTELVERPPRFPDLDDVDLRNVQIDYDPGSDMLVIHLFGRDREAISLDLNDYLYARLDPESHVVVGFQVDDFLQYAVQQEPRWFVVVDLLGLRAQQVDEARQRMGADRMKQAALRSLFDDFHLAIS